MNYRRFIRRVAQRCGLSLVTLWLASMVIFAALSGVKGDAATARLAGSGSAQQIALLQHELGLDRSLPVRYIDWLTGVLQGDWGQSYSSGRPVSQILLERGRYSLLLGVTASLLLLPLTLLFGLWSGLRPGSWADRMISLVSLGLLGLPEFVTGTLLIVLFSLTLHWLPALSLVSTTVPWWQQLPLMVLPVATLLSVCLVQNIRLLRVGVISASQSPASENARLNGIAERTVIMRWILPVALVNCLPVLARYITYLISGALVAETLFAWPGLAATLLNATLTRDTPVVMGVSLLVCTLTVSFNLLADLLTALLNPAGQQGEVHG